MQFYKRKEIIISILVIIFLLGSYILLSKSPLFSDNTNSSSTSIFSNFIENGISFSTYIFAAVLVFAVVLVSYLLIANKKLVKKIEKNLESIENSQILVNSALEEAEKSKKLTGLYAQELQMLKEAFESTFELVLITDPNGIILYVNNAIKRMTGFEKNEVVGKKAGTQELWGGLMSKREYENFWNTIKNEKKPFRGEFKNRTKSGDNYTAEAVVSPILDDIGNIKFFVGVERDVSQAKKVDRMKTEFILLVSHQLRTPLSAMKWYLGMLLNGDMGELSKDQTKFIQDIFESNDRMISLVNTLLSISKIQTGRIVIEPEPTDMVELANTVLAELKRKIDEKKLKVTIDADPSLPKVNTDPKLIRNVYLNILSNSVKYTPDEGEIGISITKDGDNVLSTVYDTGYGIPKNEHNLVFQRFFRGSNVSKIVTEGTGLGLYLVKDIIAACGGRIWFESEENTRTTFWFTVPIEFKKQQQENQENKINSLI